MANKAFVALMMLGVAAFAHSCGKIEVACWDKEPGSYVMMRGSIPGPFPAKQVFRCPGVNSEDEAWHQLLGRYLPKSLSK